MKWRVSMSKILQKYVNFSSLTVSLTLLQRRAVLTNVISFDILGVKAIVCLYGGGHRLGGPVLLGGGHWEYICDPEQLPLEGVVH